MLGTQTVTKGILQCGMLIKINTVNQRINGTEARDIK